MSNRARHFLFAVTTVTAAVSIAVGLVLVGDLALRARASRHGANGYVNWQGYRGPVIGRKKPREYRIVVIGGSTVYGMGVRADEAFPAALERLLGVAWVVNLGYMGDGAYADGMTARDYTYLQYDLVIFYEGYNDLGGEREHNTQAFRQQSRIFQWTGYYPWFPLMAREKARVLLGGAAVAPRDRAVISPRALQRVSGAALTLLADMDRYFTDTQTRRENAVSDEDPCLFWTFYRSTVRQNIRDALIRGVSVLQVAQPWVQPGFNTATASVDPLAGSRLHHEQQACLDRDLANFSTEARFHRASVADAVRLGDPTMSLNDNLHLTPAGNLQIAQALVAPVRAIMAGDLARSASRPRVGGW